MPETAATNEIELSAKARDLAESVKLVQITSPETYAMAANGLQLIKGMTKEIKDFFAPLKEKAFAAHRALTAAENEKLAPLVEAERFAKGAMTTWQLEQEAAARVEQRRLEEEARKRAEEEKLLDAIDAEQAGEPEAAERILAEPVLAPVVRIAPPVPQVAGISMRETWSAEVVDMRALVRAVADGKVPMRALVVDTVFLNGQARALKGDMNYPGVRAVSKRSVASSAVGR